MEKKDRKEVQVSVVIPTYNCGNYIEQAMESVLRQTVKTEILIIDDASSDDTENRIARFLKREEVFCIKNIKRRGVSQARNQGIALARGAYLAFLDADDWWDCEKLHKQLLCIEKNKSVLCYTGRELYTQEGVPIGKRFPVEEFLTYQDLLYQNQIACSSVLLRTEIAREFPMAHDEIHEDYLTWLRILRKYQYAYGINEPLLKTRLTIRGKSRKKWKTFRMTYGVYRYLGMGRIKSFYYMGNHIVRRGIRYL